MKILAIDTATENCSAALLIDGRLTAREELLQRGSAERILPMVCELLTETRVSLNNLDAIAFGRGPGGFTGVRLAASVTQGLAFGSGIPVVAVSNLRALAQRALDDAANVESVLVCADARMREVYWGCFRRDAAGVAQAVAEERVGPPEGVELPAGWEQDSVAGVGTGFGAHPRLRTLYATRLAAVEGTLLPRATEIARLAALEFAAGRVLTAEQAIPVYLRDNVAQPAPSH